MFKKNEWTTIAGHSTIHTVSNDHPHPTPTRLTPCFELGGLRKIRTNLGPAGRGDQSICNQNLRTTVLKSGEDGERGQDLAVSDGSMER